MALTGKICLVTGASRGLGKGIAVQLGEAGATVYITGRGSSADAAAVGGSLEETETEITARGGKGIAVVCDHSNDQQVKSVFDRIKSDAGKLDILVNNAYSAVTVITKEFGAKNTFWQHGQEPGEFWDTVNQVGLRNHYVCSVHAAKMMTEQKQGLIVNVSSFGGTRYLFNVAYGVGKAAMNRMSADMALELRKHNVACVTLYPGPVLTENIKHAMDNMNDQNMSKLFGNGETAEFSGKAVAGLGADPNIMAKSGRILVVAELAKQYGFTDANGCQPPSLRQLNLLLAYSGYSWLASIVPDFVKIPGFLVASRATPF